MSLLTLFNRQGIKSLKNGKASGHDKIVNEMLKASNDMMLLAYVKLFNIVLDTGHIPDNWTIGIIKPIFKNKGSKNDTDNYRGITLLSCLLWRIKTRIVADICAI